MTKISKKDQRKILNNYRNNMIIGIISGLIVASTISLYNLILDNTKPPFSVPLAFLGATLLIIFLVWLLVERPIKRQEEIWAAKTAKSVQYGKK